MAQRSFSPALFSFLRDLADNNDRDWFAANKDRYEEHVKEAGLQFIGDFQPRLAKISRHFVADPRAVGGSMFRIYRDTRFSKDKTPYKTNTGMHFRHEAAKDVHAPGFYLHLEPSGSFAGVGIWRPDGPTVKAVRAAILDDPAGWTKATRSKRFTSRFELEGESLVRPPQGVDPDHPLIEDLKRKDFVASTRISQKVVTSPGFIDEFAAICRDGAPFMAFLCRAVGVAY